MATVAQDVHTAYLIDVKADWLRHLKNDVLEPVAAAALAAVGWAVGVAQRSTLIVDVLRDRNALYRTSADGSVERIVRG